MEYIPSRTLLCLIAWGRRGQIANFGKNPSSLFNNYKSHSILKNLDNSSAAAFYLTLLLQLSTKKEPPLGLFSEKKIPIRILFYLFNEITPQPNLLSAFSIE